MTLLHTLEAPPQEFLHYMSEETPQSKLFLQNIKVYDACFQKISFGVTSLNTNIDEIDCFFHSMTNLSQNEIITSTTQRRL